MKSLPTKKERVYEKIKWAIIFGEIKPGDVLNENEMSQKYDVGKTPTREALIVLAHENFIKPIPRVGYVVTEPAVQDILEMFHLRTILEVEAIGQAIDRLTDDEIKGLIKNNIEEKKIYLTNDRNLIREHGYRLNQDFHMAIAQASGNSRLAMFVQQLIHDMLRALLVDPDLADHTQHENILGFIQQRDKAKAQEAMRKHIEETRSRVLNRF